MLTNLNSELQIYEVWICLQLDKCTIMFTKDWWETVFYFMNEQKGQREKKEREPGSLVGVDFRQ